MMEEDPLTGKELLEHTPADSLPEFIQMMRKYEDDETINPAS